MTTRIIRVALLLLTLKYYQRAVIGPWNHGATQNANPYQTAASKRAMQSYEWLRFFDHYLKGSIDENGKVTYLTEGVLRALHRRVSNE